MDVLPALVGVGYICGPRIASYMFSGSVLSWFVLMPLISLFAGDAIIFLEQNQSVRLRQVSYGELTLST